MLIEYRPLKWVTWITISTRDLYIDWPDGSPAQQATQWMESCMINLLIRGLTRSIPILNAGGICFVCCCPFESNIAVRRDISNICESTWLQHISQSQIELTWIEPVANAVSDTYYPFIVFSWGVSVQVYRFQLCVFSLISRINTKWVCFCTDRKKAQVNIKNGCGDLLSCSCSVFIGVAD